MNKNHRMITGIMVCASWPWRWGTYVWCTFSLTSHYHIISSLKNRSKIALSFGVSRKLRPQTLWVSRNSDPLGISKTQTLKTQTFGWSNTFVVQTVRLSNGGSPLLFNESSQATVSQSSQALQRSWASRHSPPTQHSTLTPLGPLFKMTMICWTQLLSWS